MTDLTKVLEAVRNSKVELDAEFWRKQNQQICENQERFLQEQRLITPTHESMNRYFDI